MTDVTWKYRRVDPDRIAALGYPAAYEGQRARLALSPAEHDTVVSFGMHQPDEDIRSGFVILAGVALFLLVVAGAIVALAWYGLVHHG